MVWEDVPFRELYQSQKDAPNVEIWLVEGAFAKFGHKLAELGVLEKCVRDLPDANRWFLAVLL